MTRKVGTTGYRGVDRVQTVNTEPSMTIESDAHLADINNIMARFAGGGLENALDEADLQFLDVSEFTDFKDLMDQNVRAEQHFMALPSKVREIFKHDLAIFLDTAHDEDKRDALVKAGFLEAVETSVADGGAASVEEARSEAAPEAGGAPE